MLFHTTDETDLNRWQSGVYYADGTPKASIRAVRAAIARAHRGVVAQCPGLKLTPRMTAKAASRGVTVTCDIDCAYTITRGRTTVRGTAVGGRPTLVRLRNLRRGERVRIRAVATVNPGAARVRVVTR
jgi:hypothetical protein